MCLLPVSKLEVTLHVPTGQEEMRLLETQESETRAAVDLLESVAEFACPGPTVAQLPVSDIEYLLLELRRQVFGDVARTDVRCPVPECRARVDVDFRIGDYLAHHRPTPPAATEADAEPGWYRLPNQQVRFRPPTAADQMACLDTADPERRLRALCMSPETAARGDMARVERALARLAPSLSGVLEGSCPECGARLEMFFDVPRFVLAEFRNQAAGLYREVDVLASRYHWTEAAILALPARRRGQYRDLAESADRAVRA